MSIPVTVDTTIPANEMSITASSSSKGFSSKYDAEYYVGARGQSVWSSPSAYYGNG